MKPELWHYGRGVQDVIAHTVHPKHSPEDRRRQLKSWQRNLSTEIRGVLDSWQDYEDKEEAERYLEYLKFLFILAGGEPCGW